MSLQAIYSEALFALAYVMLNVITKECVHKRSETKHTWLKESAVESPCTLVEPANRFPSTADRWRRCLDSGWCGRSVPHGGRWPRSQLTVEAQGIDLALRPSRKGIHNHVSIDWKSTSDCGHRHANGQRRPWRKWPVCVLLTHSVGKPFPFA